MKTLAAAGLLIGSALGAASIPRVQVPLVVEVSARGFEPSTLTAAKGDTIVIEVRSDGGEHCFAIDALRIEKRVLPDRPAVVELTPTKAGRFPFYCCVETGPAAKAERGELVVRR